MISIISKSGYFFFKGGCFFYDSQIFFCKNLWVRTNMKKLSLEVVVVRIIEIKTYGARRINDSLFNFLDHYSCSSSERPHNNKKDASFPP